MDEVFRALADASRRRLLDDLNRRDGQTLRDLCAGSVMTRQSVSKHLAVLESANLVSTVRRGREKLHYLNAAPINAISDRWIDQYGRSRSDGLTDVWTAPQAAPTPDDAFVYTTYIRTTPERLWQAITDPVFSERYLGHALISSWEKGANYAWLERGLEIEHPDQVVSESDPYRRLGFTFHSFVQEMAATAGIDATTLAQAAQERRSQVSLDIEPVGDQVKLTVIHDDFAPNSVVRSLITAVWPYKLSALKTGLEQA